MSKCSLYYIVSIRENITTYFLIEFSYLKFQVSLTSCSLHDTQQTYMSFAVNVRTNKHVSN